MRVPRWTVYPSLALIAGFIVLAIPERREPDPFAGAARGSLTPTTKHPEVVVLGIDGMDPDILKEVMELFPERMPNFRWLIDSADGIKPLGTSTPPQSPVAWSNFITGMNPGGHGIFDFIHRDPTTRAPAASTTTPLDTLLLPGPGCWQVPVPLGGGDSNRSGAPFWTLMADAGVPADIWRMPANFPVEASKGLSFPGMMTPAVDSAYGEAGFFTTDPSVSTDLKDAHPSAKVTLVTERAGVIATSLRGPEHALRHCPGEDNYTRAALTVYVDRESNAAAFELGDERVVLAPGQWSHFIPVVFSMLPMGMMDTPGICRLYLRSLEPEVEFYVSPVNLDPMDSGSGVSEPSNASAELAEGIGLYYTQGMAEDVNALKNELLTDAEFMAQANEVFVERKRMLDYAIDRYRDDAEGGLLFFYFSTIDLCSHMMWRHTDASHPFHDPAIASQDSSWWSGRPGTTWKDTVYDLYLKMDPVLGRIRERLGDDITYIVMSDHGFAAYRRKFSLNTWLYENGYLVLHAGMDRELPKDDPDFKQVNIFAPGVVDWSKTTAYGMGFNGLYLNMKGRERDNPDTDEDESGIVPKADARALLTKIKSELESIVDEATGLKPVLRCDLASEVYSGARVEEAPDMLVGFNAGYGNSDPASLGRVTNAILEDNTGGTFNGSHLMAPEVVDGILISNRGVREGAHRLEDLTVEVLRQFAVPKPDSMKGHPVLK